MQKTLLSFGEALWDLLPSGPVLGGAPLNLEYVDLSASNGVVHVVDAVLLPPPFRP